MAIGVTAFPGALDTADTLVRVSNLALATTVSDNPLLIGATTVNVASTTNYAASGTITIEGEVITYTGTTGTSFTGCTRGADGTTAASHPQNAAVMPVFTALHHTALRDAIIAVEGSLVGVSSFPASPVANQTCFRSDLGVRYRARLSSGTVTTAITGTGSQTVTTVAAHNLAVGDLVTIGAETVAVTAAPSTTQITASWASAHAGSSAYTAVGWRQMGDAHWETSAVAPASPPTGYRYVNLTDDARYRWDGAAYQKMNTRVKLADVTYATDQYSNTATAAASFGVLGPSVSFTVQDPNSSIEIVLDCGVQFSAATATQIGIHALIDGTTRYPICGGVTPGSSGFAGLSGGSRNIGSLSAGAHTVQYQFIMVNAGTISLLPVTFPNYLFFVVQVFENKS